MAKTSELVKGAARHELKRRREALRESLRHPHPEWQQFAATGFDEWAKGLPPDDAAELVDLRSGTTVRWVAGKGWVKDDR